MTARIPTIVLGGTGYVAGELLRLIAGHPQFELAAVMSDSQPGDSVAKASLLGLFARKAAFLRTPKTSERARWWQTRWIPARSLRRWRAPSPR